MRSRTDHAAEAGRGVFEPRRRVVALALVLIIGIVLGLGLGYTVLRSQMMTPEQRAAAASPLQPPMMTAPVQRDERQQVVTLAGAVQNSGTVAVHPALPPDDAAAVLVKMGIKRGQSVQPGMFLAEVSGQPVFALPGAFPFYRDLTMGDRGEDVDQLHKGLKAAGYAPEQMGEEITPSTQRALERLLTDRGYSTDLLQSTARVGDYDETGAGDGESGLVIPRGLFVVLGDLPAAVVDVSSKVGDSLDETSTLFTVADGTLVLSASIATVQAADVTPHQAVTFTVGDHDEELTGTVSGVEPDPDNPDLSTITITPDAPLPAESVGTDARAAVVTASSDGPVLFVPISAVRSDSTDAAYVLLAPREGIGDETTPERHAVTVVEVIDGAAVLEESTAPAEGTEVIVSQTGEGSGPEGQDPGGDGES